MSTFEPGGKLAGLVVLPPPWVPPFFEIDAVVYDRYCSREPVTVSLVDLLSPTEKLEIQRKVLTFGTTPEDVTLLVRSNGTAERLQDRGLL
jgi:hypothetical protein